jgi:hypothetical protein
MADDAVMKQWAKESLAMMMIGDALVTLVDPQTKTCNDSLRAT